MIWLIERWRKPTKGGAILFASLMIAIFSVIAPGLANTPSSVPFSPPSLENYKTAFARAEILAAGCDKGNVAACRLAFDVIDTPMKTLQGYQGRNRVAIEGYRLPALSSDQRAFLDRYQKMVVQLGVAGCIRDHGYSCYRIGFANLQGADGGKIGDLEGLEKPLEKSCTLGSPDGCAALAGPLRFSKDTEKLKRAHDLSSKACAEGSANGCAIYGYLLKNGKGVPQDYALAAGFLRFACYDGHGHACGDLANLYENGQGVSENLSKAEGYYNRMCVLPFGQAGCRKAAKMLREYEESAFLGR